MHFTPQQRLKIQDLQVGQYSWVGVVNVTAKGITKRAQGMLPGKMKNYYEKDEESMYPHSSSAATSLLQYFPWA